MSLKHLGPLSTMPELKKGVLRLYSMVFCPFAERTRLVLAAKKIPYETVNVNLHKKPQWYLELNPLGQVPCLQFDDGRVIQESLINSEYLDAAFPENRLQPTDPYTNAQHKLIVEGFSKSIGGFYKVLRSNTEEDKTTYLNDLEKFQSKLEHNFIGGDVPAFADYMVWPWLERIEALETMDKIHLDRERFKTLLEYIDRMKELPAAKETRIPTDVIVGFINGYLTGGEPDYDSGVNIAA